MPQLPLWFFEGVTGGTFFKKSSPNKTYASTILLLLFAI